jgi:hypothetical protein
LRVTTSHVAGGEIVASYFGSDRTEYVRVLTDALASASVRVAEDPAGLAATFIGDCSLTIRP